MSTAGHAFLNNSQVDLAALSYPTPTADFPPNPYLDTDYPHPLGGFEGQRLAHVLSRHFQFNFGINQNSGPVASASTYGPPSAPLEAPLEAPPSAPPSAPLEAPPSALTPSAEPTDLDLSQLTCRSQRREHIYAKSHLHQRSETWKGLDQGFPLLHHYWQVPGFTQHQPSQPLYFENPQLLSFIRAGLLRPEDDSFLGLFDEVAGPDGHFYLHVIHKLDFPLYKFTSGVFVTSIDFLLVRPNRKADTLWKNNTLSNIQLVSSFFFRVLSRKISGVHPTEQVDICTALMNVSTTLL
ncbi:hypothetical protein HYDPIDRAFT_171254 [Hydnomerulius pinastri MD-312]|uniref:Uncharacterized protein n=1 Tax=Hydnomerulius pinastri MD-312 TaxID=994086 RepID=A0A0C9VLJ1_9AGAM|nr:hypothetical protein HYDPIDRAFT_171254 [Hydnomerulius pinastri MD-312]